jgi:hypothetical protein
VLFSLPGAPPPSPALARSWRSMRRSSWLRSRRPDDPDDGANGDHFRSGGAGDGVGAGEGAGVLAFAAATPFAMDCAPTNAKIVPAFSAVTSRQLGGSTYGFPVSGAIGLGGVGLSGLSVMLSIVAWGGTGEGEAEGPPGGI